MADSAVFKPAIIYGFTFQQSSVFPGFTGFHLSVSCGKGFLGRWKFFLPCIDDVGHQTNFPFVPVYKRGYGGNHNVSYPVQKMYRLNHSETVRSLSLPTAWRTHARKRYYLSDIPRPYRSLLYPSSQNESPM